MKLFPSKSLTVTSESHPPSTFNMSPKQQNLSTFSSDSPLPTSRCKSALSLSVIGLSTLQLLQKNGRLALSRLPFTPLHP